MMILTAVLHRKSLLSSLLMLLILPCASAHLAIGQLTQSQPSTPVQAASVLSRQQEITNVLSNSSLKLRVYRHFFNYQHYLDTIADQQDAAGKDGSWLRLGFQRRLGFSDSEYQPIRASVDRVAANVKALLDEAKSNPGKGPAELAAERDQLVQSEIETLTSQLSAKNKAAFEDRLVRMFVPRQVTHPEVQQ